MILRGKSEKAPVSTVKVAFLEGDRAMVSTWVDTTAPEQPDYHAILHFLMYYGRMLFFLSFRDSAYELVEWMNEAVHALAAAGPDDRVMVSREWRFDEVGPAGPRAEWSSSLLRLRPGQYRCKDERPKDPEDRDGQGVTLLHLQRLVDTLSPASRAFLALAVVGMHEYYDAGIHWHSSKSLHPAPAYGMDHARRVLGGEV